MFHRNINTILILRPTTAEEFKAHFKTLTKKIVFYDINSCGADLNWVWKKLNISPAIICPTLTRSFRVNYEHIYVDCSTCITFGNQCPLELHFFGILWLLIYLILRSYIGWMSTGDTRVSKEIGIQYCLCIQPLILRVSINILITF